MLPLLFACVTDAASERGSGADSGSPALTPCEAAPKVTWENWGQGFFASRCGACHSPSAQDRNGAPEGIDFVTRDDLLLWERQVRAAVLEGGTMPLGGGLTPDEVALLSVLLECGP